MIKNFILSGLKKLWIDEINDKYILDSFISNHTIAYIMPPERSIDIDDKLDFDFAEYLLRSYYDKVKELE